VRKHRTFSKEFKKAAVEKLLDPNGTGVTKLSEELDLYQSTLYAWKKKYANSQTMTKSNKNKDWSPEQMLEAIIKTASMN
jgi:transposase-like protein